MLIDGRARAPLFEGETAYLDASIIISYLLDDPPDMAEAANACFHAAEQGDIRLLITPTTLAEVVWVLSAAYKKSRMDIAPLMLAFMTAEGIDTENRDEITLALSFFKERNVDFADALLAARALLSGPAAIYSFDRHFDRIPGIQRRIPGRPSPQGE
jgi:predicted nucleic acid-binding protein